MRSLFSAVGFVALALVCWGLFGPLLQAGVGGMQYSSLRPLICVGATFSLIAIAAPIVWLQTGKDKGSVSASGVLWAILAGAAGALGALGVSLALKYRGNPLYVMPAAFGIVAVVYALFDAWLREERMQIGRIFPVGAVLAALGAAGVIIFSPTATDIAITQIDDGRITIIKTGLDGLKETKWTADNPAQLRTDPKLAEAFALYQRFRPLDAGSFMLVVACIVLSGVCWGGYGPLLKRSGLRMHGSRLRPLLAMGLSFLAAAVVLPTVVLLSYGEDGGWTMLGTTFSLLAGVVAAVGAVGIVLALISGGRPTLSMAAVFGAAPLVSIAGSLTAQQAWAYTSSVYAAATALLVAGVVLVLLFPPHESAEDNEQGRDKDDPRARAKNSTRQSASTTAD